MRALKTQDSAGNTYYVKCDNLLITNSTVNVCMYKEPYPKYGTTRKFFRNFSHLNKWMAEHPEFKMLGKPTFSCGNKAGNSRDEYLYEFED